ncbi:MAG: hypothetical protein AABY80_03635, partial [Candidatus Deferrimicrobiota bacterium]
MAILRQGAEILAALAQAGLHHQDLRAENLFWSAKEGLFLNELVLQPLKETWDNVLYAAPEGIREGRWDIRGDMYALGGLGYHLLAGRPPVAGDPPGELLRRHQEAEVPSLRGWRA